MSITSKLIPLTPMELYTRRVASTYDGIRAANADMDFLPADFGGIFAQRTLLEDKSVLEVVDIKGGA